MNRWTTTNQASASLTNSHWRLSSILIDDCRVGEMNQAREEKLDQKLAAFERWAEEVDPEQLEPAPLESLGAIAFLVNQQQQINKALEEAVAEARARGRTWSEIGALLGVSKQAAQQKYGIKAAAAS